MSQPNGQRIAADGKGMALVACRDYQIDKQGGRGTWCGMDCTSFHCTVVLLLFGGVTGILASPVCAYQVFVDHLFAHYNHMFWFIWWIVQLHSWKALDGSRGLLGPYGLLLCWLYPFNDSVRICWEFLDLAMSSLCTGRDTRCTGLEAF